MTTVAWALLAFGLASIGTILFVEVTVDEAWFLQVIRRVRRGERLYCDVFFGAGPLGPWLALAVTRFLGAHGLWLRLMGVGYGIGIAAAVAWLAVSAGLTESTIALVVLALFAFGGPQLALHNAYGHLSTLGVLVAAGALLEGEALLTGLALGVAICSRYPVGLVGSALLLPVLVVEQGAVGWLALASLCGFVVGVAIALGSEGRRGFIDRAVRNKTSYLATGRISPLAGLHSLFDSLRVGGIGSVAAAPVLVSYLIVGVAAAVSLYAGATRFPTVDSRTLTGAALAVCSLSVCWPRADRAHVVAAVPLALASCALAAAPWPGVGEPVAWALSGVSLVAGVGGVARITLQSDLRRGLPGFVGLVARRRNGLWPDENDDLLARAGRRIFFLRSDAAFFYVAGGFENPTAFDYPYASTFGPRGQAEVRAAIENGAVPWVCLNEVTGPLTPHELQDFVRQMTRVADVSAGALYQIPRSAERKA